MLLLVGEWDQEKESANGDDACDDSFHDEDPPDEVILSVRSLEMREGETYSHPRRFALEIVSIATQYIRSVHLQPLHLHQSICLKNRELSIQSHARTLLELTHEYTARSRCQRADQVENGVSFAHFVPKIPGA
jgi:hypothetical protein